jgi:drug/metabolite transporter (DMT)-like permease
VDIHRPIHPRPRRERVGAALCALAAAGFAARGIGAKLAYAAGANVLTLLTVRFAVAAALLWLLARRLGVARVGRREALLALGLGVAIHSAETGLVFAALTRIDVSLTELIVFSYPALVVLGAILLRQEAASRRRSAALAVATAGVALVIAGGHRASFDLLGALLALGAAVFYAAYVLGAARLTGRIHALPFAALVCTGEAIAFAGTGAATGSLHFTLNGTAWGWILAIALGPTVVAHTAFLGGMARLGPSRASILAMLEPVFACVFALAAFGERLAAPQLLGGALVVCAAVAVEARSVASESRGAPARSPGRTAARALRRVAARRRRLGVRTEVGRLSSAGVRGRELAAAPVAGRQAAGALLP